MPSEPIFIVEDDDAARESLQALLETAGYQSVAFASGTAFLDSLRSVSGACVVLDIRMSEMDGLEVQRRLNDSGTLLPVVFVTGHGDVTMAVRAMHAGAIDFIEKPVGRDRLLESVARAIDVGRSVRRDEEEKSGVIARIDRLTARERDVLDQLVMGRPNKVAARRLGISYRTIEIYRKNVMQKMGAQNLSHLVRMAIVAGLDSADDPRGV